VSTLVCRRRKVLVDSLAAAKWFQMTHHVTLTPATIRQWARRGHIRVYLGGIARYDLREIEEHARQRGYLDS